VIEAAPAPRFPRWLDRLLTPLLGPQLSPWVAALRTSVLGLGALLGGSIMVAVAAAAGGLDLDLGAVETPFDAGFGWEVIALVVIIAPILENAVLVGLLALMSVVRAPATLQLVAIFLLAAWAHAAARANLLGMVVGLVFVAMAWQYRTWAPVKGRRAAYGATIALHMVWNGLLTAIAATSAAIPEG
jgi:hypothetical protein